MNPAASTPATVATASQVLPDVQPSNQPVHILSSAVRWAFQGLSSTFEKVGLFNLAGCVVIVLSFALLGVVEAAIASTVFAVMKGVKAYFETPNSSSAQAIQDVSAAPLPKLPEGSLRSRYFHRSIQDHDYQPGQMEAPEQLALALQSPIHRNHYQTCGAITLTLMNYFYEHGFEDMTPYKLDALLARGIQVDGAIRARGGLGNRSIDIFSLLENMDGELPFLRPNFGALPEHIDTPSPQEFELLLNNLAQHSGSSHISGAILASGHFTGLYIRKSPEGEILDIYASESRQTFYNGIDYDYGSNKGAILARIGSTVEEAAQHLASFYERTRNISLYIVD